MVFDYKQEYHRYRQYYLRLQDLSTKPIAQASFTLIASLLTAAFLGIFAIRPALITIAKLTKEIQDREKINKQLESKVKTLTKVQSAYEEILPKIPLIDAALPKKPEFENLERKIEYLAWQNGVIITAGSFSSFPVIGDKPEETTKTKKPAEEISEAENLAEQINISLSIAGSYDSIKNFITNLEQLDRVIKIKAIVFSKKTKVKGADLQATIRSEVFYKYLTVEKD